MAQFDPAPPVPIHKHACWRRVLLGAGLFVTAFVLTWLRIPDEAKNQLWAEDGRRFLGDALAASNALSLVFSPYAGYLHLVPRICAAIAIQVADLEHLPIAMTVLSILISSAVAVMVFFLAWRLDLGPIGRFGLYGATFLAPALTTEILGNTANLHWFFLWLAPWLFLCRPHRLRYGVAWGLVALIAALTEIQMVLFLPLLLWCPKLDRRLWIAGGAVVGIGAQVMATLWYPRAAPYPFEPTVASVTLIARGFTAHVAGGVWSPMTPSSQMLDSLGWVGLSGLLLGPVALGAVWLFRAKRSRLIVSYVVVAAAVLWTASSIANNLPREVLLPLSSHETAISIDVIRNAVVPAWLLTTPMIMGIDELVRRRPAWPEMFIVTLLGVALLAAWVSNYQLDARMRQQASSWTEEVARAEVLCASGRAESVVLSHPPTTWGMVITCDALRARA